MQTQYLAEKLILGTVQFGMHYGISNNSGQVGYQDVEKILEYAISAGIKTLDTAAAYGEAEEILGTIGVREFDVISKLPLMKCEMEDVDAWVFSTVENSINKLGIDRLSGLLLHAPAQLLSSVGKKLAEAVYRVKEQGLASRVGVSVYSASELISYQSVFASDIVQLPRNIIDGRDRNIIADSLIGKELEIHARSIFLQGLLLLPEDELPDFFRSNKNVLLRFHQWCASNGVTPLEACVGAVAAMPDVNKMVVGIQRVEELQQIVCALESSCLDIPCELQIVDEHILNPSNWPQK